jgi:hypothetical protein
MCSVFLEFGTVKFHLSIQDFYFLNRRIVVQPLSSLLLSFTFHWNLFSFFWFFFFFWVWSMRSVFLELGADGF